MPAQIPQDGRLPSFPEITPPLDDTAVMYIVSPGNNQLGASYRVPLSMLAQYFASQSGSAGTVVVTSGATYNVPTDTSRVLINKTVGSPTGVVLPLAENLDFAQPVLIKDAKGDADSNPITITFTGGELCDGLASIEINTAYGWVWITPMPTGGAWYMS